MGALTEPDIVECLVENFRLAAEHCDDLAKKARKGPTYNLLREELKLIEGAARQLSYWRDDSRWLQIGIFMAQAHQKAGGWLRGMKGSDGIRRKIPEGKLHPLFVGLGNNLRMGLAAAERLRTARTGRIGTILPDAVQAPHRDTKPLGWRKTGSGLIVPETMQ